ncbi:Cof-type HAD-IIB family hydrolase [Collinsella sp. An268]|uniref:Cof-type HAD-IIB family hydrolase n=1 Tax=Collinsella sp. An268 TaxID=1965612 RepID=UPI000B39A251|nr:Cof-type HAD-IIB family hydrolase [Collinsella sp. An268]OUO64975.1 hypothetical protein B5F70_02650 [Collinsella sp. An268]
MIKAAFFDIDGTLLSFETHAMPPSTVRALAALRAQGIRCVISSGRPTYQLPPELREGFDAYVTLNGQLCYDAEGTYRSCPIAEADVRAIVGQVEEGVFDALVLQRERSFVNALTPRVQAVARQANLVYEPDDIARAFDAPVYQFCVFVEPGEEGVFLDKTTSVAATRWTNLFCDVVPREGGKAFGVEATLARFGLGPEEAVAFGDGENDLSMFGAVGTSVAMGNAWDSVKERATHVTTGVDDDGIWNACRALGLI